MKMEIMQDEEATRLLKMAVEQEVEEAWEIVRSERKEEAGEEEGEGDCIKMENKVAEYLKKCAGIEFTPYLDRRLQKQFYCNFDGLIEVQENEQAGCIYYNKWYSKGGRSYPMAWLPISMIKKLMKDSLKEKKDLIIEIIKEERGGSE